ncbi:hypothetical protein B0A50_00127 [Salinomyces thailandicus]|uniref:F-box domain-containing protein n=1 Tax=Salinomyces thailandicus TaxID=706561 RepID=A0A4U0UFP6_9PEZI|nr:hypothetical protein B0A50_00127 [Salinomyces thailandica]
MAKATLTDLPPELLDHIIEYLPTANALANLEASSKSLSNLKDAWTTFNRTRFPSLHPTETPSQKDTARTLTSLSKARDRRAFVARYTEPHGSIHAFPGGKKVERWKKPRGQTIGFTPQVDVFEDVGQVWRDRREVLAFSAGAEVCVRRRTRRGSDEDVSWSTYRPLSAYEGRDDVTTLHLLRPDREDDTEGQRLISGTANGDLCILSLSEGSSGDVPVTYFVTNGQPVRSSGLLRHPGDGNDLLVANMGDSRVSVYSVDASLSKIAPLTSLDIRPPELNGAAARHQRVWSSEFLSSTRIATGIGPSSEPIHVYDLSPSGLSKDPLRKFGLQNTMIEASDDDSVAPAGKKRSSSIYPIVPLPAHSTAGSGMGGNVFLSGAYDGVVRLHDLRSDRDVEVMYSDPTDESAIYSLLPRGQESLVAGGSRHSLLKFFDLRLGAKAYSYTDLDVSGNALALANGVARETSQDWNLFLRPHSSPQTSGRGGNNSSRRSHESSVYSLASPSASSPFLYAGVENAVLELAFTNVLDKHPDPAFFRPWQRHRGGGKAEGGRRGGKEDLWNSKEVLDLAMYDQSVDMKLCTQRSMWETFRLQPQKLDAETIPGLDERWRVGSGDSGLNWTRGTRGT